MMVVVIIPCIMMLLMLVHPIAVLVVWRSRVMIGMGIAATQPTIIIGGECCWRGGGVGCFWGALSFP